MNPYKWCRALGGNRWNTRRAWRPWTIPRRLRLPYRWAMLLSAIICRFRGHAVDGREWGGLGRDGCVDVWCSRCFHWYARVPADSLPFVQKVIEITKAVRDDFPGTGEEG